MVRKDTNRLTFRLTQHDREFLERHVKERGMTFTGWVREKIREHWAALPESERQEIIKHMLEKGLSPEEAGFTLQAGQG